MKNSLFCALLMACFQTAPSAGFGQEPATFARFVPERADDFAWENDLVAFRAYGPALRRGKEDSGIDCWLKRVHYPILNKWYEADAKGIASYHQDKGEGYDPYHVGSSRGCGGTALWINEQMVTSKTYLSWKVLQQEREKTVFELTYEYPVPQGEAPIQEVKRISIVLGNRFFRSESSFTRAGKPLADLPVAIGITTHNGKAVPVMAPEKGWIACWEKIDGSGLGTGALLEPGTALETRELKSPVPDQSHVLMLTKTNTAGRLICHAGYGWERAGDILTFEDWKNAMNNYAETLRSQQP